MSRSTAKLIGEFNGADNSGALAVLPSLSFAFVIPPDLQKRLGELQVSEEISSEEFIPCVQNVSVVVLGKIFARLNSLRQIKKLSEKHLATIEEYRLLIMKTVCAQLKNHEKTHPAAYVMPIEEELFAKIYSWLKKKCPVLLTVLFGLFFTIGFVFEAIFYYAGFAEMLGGLFPALVSLVNPVTLVVCGILTALNLILYLSFDGSMLGEMFGVRVAANEKQKLDACTEQLSVAREINRLLSDRSVGDNTSLLEYLHYADFGLKCNDMIVDRQMHFTDCTESKFRTGLRIGITILGALLTLGSGYFSGLAILPALGLTLATPLGVAFVCILMASMFITFFAMQRKGIAHLISPNLDKRQELRKQLNEFEPKQVEDFTQVILSKSKPQARDEVNDPCGPKHQPQPAVCERSVSPPSLQELRERSFYI